MSVLASSLRFRPANALHCNRPLEYGGYYLSKKSGAVQWSAIDNVDLPSNKLVEAGAAWLPIRQEAEDVVFKQSNVIKIGGMRQAHLSI